MTVHRAKSSEAPWPEDEAAPRNSGAMLASKARDHEGCGETPSADRVLETVLVLSRTVSIDLRRGEIAHRYVAALADLFAGRRIVCRMLATDNEATSVYVTHAALDHRIDSPELTRESLERHGLDRAVVESRGVAVVDEYAPCFEARAVGFDVPIVDGDEICGVLAVEYPRGIEELAGDRASIVQLALHLGAALRNARLVRESMFLREYLEKLIECANVPMLVTGSERDVRVVNRAFLGLIGAKRDDVLGRDFVSLVPDPDRLRIGTLMKQTMRGEKTSYVEVRLPSDLGKPARVSISTTALRNAHGESEGVIVIARDLAEIELLEEQVIHAEKLATLGQLAAGVVHELNNPLTSISVYSDYLLKRGRTMNADPGDLEKLSRIVQSADRILRFTRDLVSYARPSSEEPRRVSLHDVLDQAIVFCEHVIAESGATVEKHYAAPLPPMLGVKGQMHQVFINLITNACHAMPQGAGHLTITTIERGGALVVRVADNGVGIPPDQLGRVFEPFFSTKSEGKGTGLGLSIVRNIVRQHHGEIEVESRIGGGTAFEISFPACPD